MTARVCEVDGLKFNDASSFTHHKQVHSNCDYSCYICCKKFNSKKTYNAHVQLQWEILTNVDEIVSKRNTSKEDLEFGPLQSENFCEVFPINFP